MGALGFLIRMRLLATSVVARVVAPLAMVVAGLVLLPLPEARAQYISVTEPVPFVCPVVCAGSSITLKVFQIENFPTGTRFEALLSDMNGSFTTGTQSIAPEAYSINGGGNFFFAPYSFSGNATDVQFKVVIPPTTPLGAGYKIRMKASTGYLSPDAMRCPAGGSIIVRFPPVALPSVPETEAGVGYWVGHIYTFRATTEFPFNTQALIDAQDFFNPNFYVGHAVYNPLSFDLDLGRDGGVPGLAAAGSSLGCATSLKTNFSMRLRRRESFAPGRYFMSIAGDDGIRLSVDGGRTWLLNSFIEQPYNGSLRTSTINNPEGICLGPNTDLVIEYFQRPADARLTFTVQRLSTPTIQPEPLSICAGQNASFFYGIAGTLDWQWEMSLNGGTSYRALPEQAPFAGVRNSRFFITNTPDSLNNAVFRCFVPNGCSIDRYSNLAVLTVGSAPKISGQPADGQVCESAIDIPIEATTAGTYTWEASADNGQSYRPITGAVSLAGFENGTTSKLRVLPTVETGAKLLVRCVMTNKCGSTTSLAANITKCAVECPVARLPNIITLNGDTANASFGGTACPLQNYSLAIFNRWGKRIFKTSVAAEAWPTKGSITKPEAGTYFYTQTYENAGKRSNLKGYIEVVR